jgi:GAF domain-containing protein
MSAVDGASYVGVPGGFTVVAQDEVVRSALMHVVMAGTAMVANCSSASITLIERQQAVTAAGTDDDALALDAAQYAADEGPCLQAGRTEQVINVGDLATEGRWPDFARVALGRGVRSSLSAPLILGGHARGSLNAYSRVRDGFDVDAEQIVSTFAAQALVIVANAQAYWAAFDGTRTLTVALESRSIIDQAKGILMGRHGGSADAAFAQLRQMAMTSDRALRDIAAGLVAQAQSGGGDHGEPR